MNPLIQIEKNMTKIKRYGVKNIGLFGSFARKEQTNKSDIDILVKFNQNKKTFDNYMDLKFFLEDLLGRKVDLVIEETIKPDLKSHIIRSAKYAQGL